MHERGRSPLITLLGRTELFSSLISERQDLAISSLLRICRRGATWNDRRDFKIRRAAMFCASWRGRNEALGSPDSSQGAEYQGVA